MNDRFRFRAWNKEEKKMYYDAQNTYDYMAGKPIIFAESFSCLLTNNEEWKVEQCTGLKDKNGNLIYEGDKVEITIFGSVGPNGGYVDSDEIYKGTVVWVRDCFLVKTDTDMLLFPHSEDCIEIIGNMHEQAEQKE